MSFRNNIFRLQRQCSPNPANAFLPHRTRHELMLRLLKDVSHLSGQLMHLELSDIPVLKIQAALRHRQQAHHEPAQGRLA